MYMCIGARVYCNLEFSAIYPGGGGGLIATFSCIFMVLDTNAFSSPYDDVPYMGSSSYGEQCLVHTSYRDIALYRKMYLII